MLSFKILILIVLLIRISFSIGITVYKIVKDKPVTVPKIFSYIKTWVTVSTLVDIFLFVFSWFIF